MWPDNETAEDLIGFQVHADLIRTLVTNDRMLPVTVGVFGDWGGGKTSIMRMLERDLQPDSWPDGSAERTMTEKVAVVYLNTWLFEGYDDAKSAILTAILLELSEHKRFGPKIRDRAKELLRSVNWMRVARLGAKYVALPAAAALMAGGAGALPALAVVASSGLLEAGKEAGQHFLEGKSDTDSLIKSGAIPKDPLDVRTFRERFGALLKDSDIQSLVVLVDDLDRCSPERLIENLEAIKLFLSVQRTAFIIGADRRVVEHAIRLRYAERATGGNASEDDGERLVTDYLEKVIQVPYRLPRLSASEIETYMVLLFCKHHLSAESFDKCMSICEQQRSTNRYAGFGYSGVESALGSTAMPDALSNSLVFSSAAAPLIADGLKGNPRQVKRFLNAFLLRKQLATIAKLASVRDDVLVKLMILEYGNEKLFSQLFLWQAQQAGVPKQLADMEKAVLPPAGRLDNDEEVKRIDPAWATTSVRRWLSMEPRLADVDLRDYFWVARDRLESTFSGLTMVSPATRVALEGLLSGNPAKRNASVTAAAALSQDERIALLDLLSQGLNRHPEDKKFYDALFALVEKDLPGGLERLADELQKLPTKSIPPAVGLQVLTLQKTKPQTASALEPAVERLRHSTDKIGTAIQSTKKGR